MKIITNRIALSVPGETVEDIDGEGEQIADELFRVLGHYPGIGLSANQIGINKRVCVISVPEKDSETGEYQCWRRRFINPEIIRKEDPFIFTKEGCLSFPNIIIETMRFNEITIKCSLNPEGINLTGLEAVVALHECDHTNGILMYQRRPKEIGVNTKCPCDSGKKFKKCCMKKLKVRELGE
jgi:peptide deformylase